MLMIRSPLRITFGGGGTDVSSFANRYGGFCISAAISKYSYVAINHAFSEGIILKYSDYENVSEISEVQHPIFREALKQINLKTPQVEIISIADVPSNGAGLGNSGAFSVALLKALYSYKNIQMSNEKIAEIACDINMHRLKKIQGKQDEYISALGGINCFEFNQDGSVNHYPLNISHETLIELEERLMLFYSGIRHDTQSILSYQDLKTEDGDQEIISNLKIVKSIGYDTKDALERGDLDDFADFINEQWIWKEKRMPERNEFLYDLRQALFLNGARASKIIGSGNGGFCLVVADDKNKVRKFMKSKNLEELRFTFDFEGCKRMV